MTSLPRRLLLGALPLLASPAFAASEAPPKAGTEFIALGDFTVNLPSVGRRHQYLMVGISVEVTGDAAQGFRDINPRLREAVLQELMKLSQRGQLRQGVIDPGALRDDLHACLAKVRSEGLKSVVITRMMHS
jgi:hypothetical protein